MTARLERAEVWTRPRPRVHFTAEQGWINDPYGIAWVGDRYHMYYQTIPGRVTWAPNCHWGHAQSRDLVHWVEQPLALVPQDFEVGCWSGSVVYDTDPPTIFYTRVTGPDLERGQVAVAMPAGTTGTWRTGPAEVVVDGPPPGLDVRSFRDPYVLYTEWGWRMLVAAALGDGSAALLQYRSADLRTWSYDGIACARKSDRVDPMWTGSLWECPQLFPIGDRWVLLVSVWDAGRLYHVAAAVGDYDGATFTPRSWQRLTHGSSAYAMSAFLDRDGRRCVLSWLREEPQNNEAQTRRAGAHSVASVLTLDPAGAVTLRPHPDVDALLGAPLAVHPYGGDLRYDLGSAPAQIWLPLAEPARCMVADAERPRATFSVRPARRTVHIDRPGFDPAELPVPAGATGVLILVDADLVEMFAEGSYGAYRIAPALDEQATSLTLTGAGTAVWAITDGSTPE